MRRKTRRSNTVFIFLIAGTISLAKGQMSEMSLEDAILKLRSSDSKDQEVADKALNAISARGISQLDGLRIATASAEPINQITPKLAWQSPAARLLAMLCADPKPQYLRTISAALNNYAPDAKSRALAYFILLGPGDGLTTFSTKLNNEIRLDMNCDDALAKLNGRDPQAFDVLLQMFKFDPACGSAASTLLKFAKNDSLPPGGLENNLPAIVSSYQRWLDKMSAIAQKCQNEHNPEYRWDDDYRQAQGVAEYYPDLLGYAGKNAAATLRRTFELKDPRLSLFALQSLLRLNEPLPSNEIQMVAADDEMRWQLYNNFKENGVLSKFPKEFATQEALARSDMVQWLCYPTELDRAPNDIELVKVISEVEPNGTDAIDIYLFKFRTTGTHWAAKDGWMTGIAGGYRRSKEPTTHSLGDTFSEFEKWDPQTEDQQVKEVRALISETWKRKAKRSAATKTNQ